MHIVLGATGHVGGATADHLLADGAPVTVVSRSADTREDWERRGARFAQVDVLDVDALRALFRTGTRAFLLNPPADPATDTDVEERRTVAAILAALHGSGLQHVVAESTMGAQPGTRIGDLSVLYGFEQGLRAQSVPATVIRAAYYMSNWDMALSDVQAHGRLDSMFPADFRLAMVAPRDLGATAARLLTGPIPASMAVYEVEGRAAHTPRDVAGAFAQALGRPVEVAVTPRERWIDTYRAIGFSAAAADAYARMTARTIDGDYTPIGTPVHGPTTLQAYIDALVRRAAD